MGGATLNNMKLAHWSLIGGLLHLVQRGGNWAGPWPAQSPPYCTKCIAAHTLTHETNEEKLTCSPYRHTRKLA